MAAAEWTGSEMGFLKQIVAPLPEIGDTFCPEYTYNLRGIPETRCPECGFGFEREAIRNIARLHLRVRLAVYRRTLKFAIVSLIFSALAQVCAANAPAAARPLLTVLLVAAPNVFLLAATLAVGWIVPTWTYLPTRFTSAALSLTLDEQRRLRRWRRFASATALVSAGVAALAWI